MWNVAFQYVLPAAVGAIAGTIASLVAPWAHWGVEKRRLRLQHRMQLIEGWRTMIERFTAQHQTGDGFQRFLEHSHEFYSLKPHLSDAFKKKLYITRGAHGPGENTTIGVLENDLIDEIARIERKWHLV